MKPFHHAVRRQTLDLAVGSPSVALALQPQLGDLNRRRLLPAIERVFDAADAPGRHIRLNRLEIDLGHVPLTGFENAVERRLENELRRALEAALREIGDGGSEGLAGNVSRTDEAARRELLAHYLLHGTFPFWAWRKRTFSLEETVLEMAENDPDGLVEVVCRLGRETRVLERLVLQLHETGLRELVRLLEPEHSTLIIAYLGHLREAHRGEPGVPLGERAFARALWLLTQLYLVRDPGSQFNRRSFVRSLLRGLAAREGISYAVILAALHLGLERTAATCSIHSSLPAVVGELARELERAANAGTADEQRFLARFRDQPALRAELIDESPPALFEPLLAELCPEEAEILEALQRLFASIPSPYRPRPEALVRRVLLAEALRVHGGEPLSEASFARVLHELFPSPLPVIVSRFLRREAAALPAGVEVFLSAVESAATRGSRPELSELAAGRRSSLLRHVTDRRTRQRWTKLLPESALAQVVRGLAPLRHRELLDAAEVLATAWAEVAPPGRPALTGRRMMWSFLLEFLARRRGTEASVGRLVSEFFAHVARRLRRTATDRGALGERLLESARRRAHAGGRGTVVAALHHDRSRLLASWESPPRRRSRPPNRDARLEPAPAGESADPLYIDNAGLVLAAPFLPHLFATLDLLERDERGKARLRSGKVASRAVHLLQYLVDARTASPEPALALNKVLCGLPVEFPVEREVATTEHDLEACDALLRSLLAQWTVVSDTSVAGLRETFLQRQGRLERTSDAWKLRLQRTTVDVLVDEVPWSISVIFHDWMAEPVHVSW